MLMLRICHYPVLNKSKIAIGSQMLEDWSCDMLPLDWALWLRSCSVVAACCCCIDLGKRRAVKSSKDKKRSGPIGPMCNRFFQSWCWIVFCPRFQRVSTSAHNVMEVPRQKTDEHRWIEMKNDEEKLTKSQRESFNIDLSNLWPTVGPAASWVFWFTCSLHASVTWQETQSKVHRWKLQTQWHLLHFITIYYNHLQSEKYAQTWQRILRSSELMVTSTEAFWDIWDIESWMISHLKNMLTSLCRTTRAPSLSS